MGGKISKEHNGTSLVSLLFLKYCGYLLINYLEKCLEKDFILILSLTKSILDDKTNLDSIYSFYIGNWK